MVAYMHVSRTHTHKEKKCGFRVRKQKKHSVPSILNTSKIQKIQITMPVPMEEILRTVTKGGIFLKGMHLKIR